MRDAGSKPERDATHDVFDGRRLRDAAVDPKPDDYQAPVNAGEGLDPHGPSVVSVQALSPRSGNAPYVAGARWEPATVELPPDDAA